MDHKLRLYNSLTNSLEYFQPIDETNIRMYACGPTVYASPHIGNARPLVVFDVLFRLLKKMYKKVTYVRNLTDVDDKINNRAKQLNIPIHELTDGVIKHFHEMIGQLNILPVTHEPRATYHIAEMLEIIQKLLDHGFAYQAEGHVLFRISKMEQYGRLSKRNVDDMISGARIEIAPYKENPLDFVLWKPSDADQPAWDSPFGKGRPGWHIECSAMSHKYLGEQFDIHAGGQDLIFPHHENEIAQNFGAFGCVMANYWVHNGMLLVEGKKMSKSLGNIISLPDILQKHDGEIVRYVLLSAHYQKTLDWTNKILHQATLALNKLYSALEKSTNHIEGDTDMDENSVVTEALCANLNTPLALNHLHEMASEINRESNQNKINALCAILKREANLLGLLQKKSDQWFKKSEAEISTEEIKEIERLIEERRQAKVTKNFALADKIRAELMEKHIVIEDTKDGAIWRKLPKI